MIKDIKKTKFSSRLERPNLNRMAQYKIPAKIESFTPSTEDIFFINALEKIKKKNQSSEEEATPQIDDILKYLKTYCNNTTLHGFNYILKQGTGFFERAFWVIALTTVWLGVIFAVQNQISSYINSSVVISVSGERVSILETPFPAITICSKNQMRPSLIKSAEMILNKTLLDKKRLHVYSTLASFCGSSSIGDFNYDVQLNHSIIEDDLEFDSIWKKVATEECENVVKQVIWQNILTHEPCRNTEAILTVDGICYSFNLMPPSQRYNVVHASKTSERVENSSNTTLPSNKDSSQSPITGGNIFASARIFLDFNSDDISEKCSSRGYGFLVRAHNPIEDPQGHRPAFIDVDKTTVIKILPKIVTTSQNLVNWKPLDRGCYFSHERKLKFYKVYTQLNCEIECQANITLELCGCNMFYQIYSFKESRICDADKFSCVLNITNNEIGNNRNPCGCLPGCNEFEYELRTYPITQTWSASENSSFSTQGFHIDNKQKSYSLFKFEYNNEEVAKKSRIGIFTFTAFIAQIGGLLGLFVGFSLVSLIEIIYYTSIRWTLRNEPCNRAKLTTTFKL